MISRQELLTELVGVGVSLGTARSRMTLATQQLKDEERITAHKGRGKDHNKLSYTDEDADLIRERLGLHAVPKQPKEDTQAQTDKTPTEGVTVTGDTPADPKPKETPIPTEDKQIEKEGETTTKEDPLKNGKVVGTSAPKDHAQPPPSSRSMTDLANTEGPTKTETKKPDRAPEKQPEKKIIKSTSFKPNWIFFAGGLLVLLFGAWYLMKKKPKPEDKKQPENEPEAIAPVNLADQYRRW